MQKLINTLAIVSFVCSAGLIGGAAYVFINKDKIVESVVDQAVETVLSKTTKKVTESLVPKSFTRLFN